MELLVLSHADVEQLLPVEECIELMAEALRELASGRVWQPLRFVVSPPETDSLLGLMPAYRSPPGAAYGLKAAAIFPGNPARGLDLHQGGVLLFDGETGELRAVVDASAVTAIRTAAVSAVATRALARAEARVLAILGSGIQARAHLQALAKVRPFERARVWSRNPEHARELAQAAEAPFEVEAAGSAEAALDGADVVVTATSAREPIVERAWLAPGAHVNAVGASIAAARELDAATVAAAALFVDSRESAVNEAGDYLFAVSELGIGPDHIRAELGEVLTGSREGRRSADELTVFKSVGLAAEDLAAAEYLDRRARETGVGTVVPV
jgi:ornithine cyclodeaminase/alanine dehydrogenase-like protein (mu-crystallin family)